MIDLKSCRIDDIQELIDNYNTLDPNYICTVPNPEVLEQYFFV